MGADRMIGWVSVNRPDPAADEATVGYWMGEAFQRGEHMSRALPLVLGAVGEYLGVRRFCAEVRHGNGASARILEKCGFRQIRADEYKRFFSADAAAHLPR